jgi:hypothetical protein
VNEREAWEIVEQVWRKLQEDHAKVWFGERVVPPMLYGRIRSGYLKDHRFYQALQICLLSKNANLCRVNGNPSEAHRLGVQGAPTSVGKREWVLLNDNPYNPPRKRLWVYFSLRPAHEKIQHVPKRGLMTEDGLVDLRNLRRRV